MGFIRRRRRRRRFSLSLRSFPTLIYGENVVAVCAPPFLSFPPLSPHREGGREAEQTPRNCQPQVEGGGE